VSYSSTVLAGTRSGSSPGWRRVGEGGGGWGRVGEGGGGWGRVGDVRRDEVRVSIKKYLGGETRKREAENLQLERYLFSQEV
jgi:hypothetical protein